MHRVNFTAWPKSDATMEKHRAEIYAWLLGQGCFVSENEKAICPEHKKEVVATMLRMFQCQDCAIRFLNIRKLKQQPLIDEALEKWRKLNNQT